MKKTQTVQFLIIVFIFLNLDFGFAQLTFEYMDDIKVFENDIELANPYAGGLNAGQYNSMDLNGDGNLDLVIFDRTSNKLNTFINTGTSYDYQPKYEHYFPNDIVNWMVLADYDCDGSKDLFTYTGFGMRVFRNLSTGQTPSWELKVDLLLTLGTTTKINLFINSTDLPGIADMDGDGDLDIMAFNFSTGATLEYHQNFSVERTGECGALDFERISRKHGDIEECICNVFTFNNEPCPDGGRQLHSGGKTTKLYDYDVDGDLDIVVGQELCADIYLIENKGSDAAPVYDSFTNLFPQSGVPVSLFTFPTSFMEDVNFDGLDDIIVTPNVRGNVGFGIDFKNSSRLYQNMGTATEPNFALINNSFLQDEMIDVGEYAYPTFIDLDGDGDEDLLIGNKGARVPQGYLSTLSFYRNDLDQFTLVNSDYFNLSVFQMIDIKPNFADINNDGKLDLYFTGRNFGNLQLHYLINTSTNEFYTFNLGELNTMSITLGGSDDPVLTDIDQDGDLDLLIARSNGRLSHFDNAGSSLSPIFELKTDTLMGLNFSSSFSNLSIAVGDINSDGTMDLVTSDRSGEIRIYSDYYYNQAQSPQSEIMNIDDIGELKPTHLGRLARLSIGTLNNKNVIAIGSLQGGIRLISTDKNSSGNEGELDVKVFPVPSKLDKLIWLQTSNTNVTYEIFSMTGERIISRTPLDQFQRKSVNLINLKTGIYLVRFQNKTKSKTVRITLGDSLD